MNEIEKLTEKLQALKDAPVAIYVSRNLYHRVLVQTEPHETGMADSLLGVEFRENPVLTEEASKFAEFMVMFDSRDAQTEWHEASREKKGRMLFGMGPMVMEPIIGRPGQGWERSTKTLDPRPEGMRVFFVTSEEGADA